MFSEITTQFETPTNPLYSERDRLLRGGRKIADLVSGNATAHGFHFPEPVLQSALREAVRHAKTYRPDPLGQPIARSAISRYYKGEGLEILPEQIVLTPGTSISYWYAFKILANSGEEILCPRPSYPLFDSIAALAGIQLTPYALRESKRWEIDFPSLESAITGKTRAIVIISPHNPTGAVATQEEVNRLAEIAARRNLAILSDEVFSHFLFDMNHLPRAAATPAPLILTLNGLSKMFALPGMKIGWIAVTGKAPLVKKMLRALEMVSDTFLPVHEIAQFALPALMTRGRKFLDQYCSGIRAREKLTMDLLSRNKNISALKPEGGFYVTLKLGEGVDEEKEALNLLKKQNVLTHPGYFYDLEGNHLVLSFVSNPGVLRKVLPKLGHY